jgi:LPS sulfotransferase NodH
LLCQVLSSTDQLGYPLEYFNGPGRRALGLPDFPDAPELQIEAVLRLGATPNGVYAVNCSRASLPPSAGDCGGWTCCLIFISSTSAGTTCSARVNLVDIENPVVDQRKVDLVIQRDAVTEQWKQRFRAENGDPNMLDDLFPDLPWLVRKVCSGLGLYRDLLRTRLV